MFTLECRQRWSLPPLHRSNVTTCLVHSSSLSSTRSFPPLPVFFLTSSWYSPNCSRKNTQGQGFSGPESLHTGLFWRARQLNQTETEGQANTHWQFLTLPPSVFSIHKDPIMSSLRIYQLNSYFSFLEYSSLYSPFANVYKPKKCVSDLLAGT